LPNIHEILIPLADVISPLALGGIVLGLFRVINVLLTPVENLSKDLSVYLH
jgi:hypothetical protein